MPAFSLAIDSRPAPSQASWSSAMRVMAQPMGETTLVASRRPPRPVSITARRTPRSAKIRKAMTVAASKKVSSCADPSARHASTTSARSHGPPTQMRSVKVCRWGEV